MDQAHNSKAAANEAREHGVALYVVKLPEAKRGFVLLSCRWVVERNFGYATRFQYLVRNY